MTYCICLRQNTIKLKSLTVHKDPVKVVGSEYMTIISVTYCKALTTEPQQLTQPVCTHAAMVLCWLSGSSVVGLAYSSWSDIACWTCWISKLKGSITLFLFWLEVKNYKLQPLAECQKSPFTMFSGQKFKQSSWASYSASTLKTSGFISQ